VVELRGRQILVVSPQPWDHAWLSKNHYAEELVRRGNRVVFLEHPRESLECFFRIRDLPQIPGLRVLTYRPLISPKIRFHIPHLYNLITKHTLKRVLRVIGVKPDLVWCFDTSLYPDLRCFCTETTIFHPVDPVPYVPQQQIATHATLVLSVSDAILDPIRRFNSRCFKIPHGLAAPFVNARHINFYTAHRPSNRPVTVGYIGSLLRPQLRHDIFQKLILENPDMRFCFWGQYDESRLGTPPGFFGTKSTEFVKFLQKQRNVQLFGSVTPAELAEQIQQVDCFLLTYSIDGSSYDGSNSHKILEYLSTGKVVVSMPLHEYANHLHLLRVVDGLQPADFVAAVTDTLKQLTYWNSEKRMAERVDFAIQHTYSSHVDKIEALLASCKPTNKTESMTK
jgi:glycosyltransferase involved in cell wall biosynthesis